MNPGPATKLDKRNETASKRFYDYVMSANCDDVIFPGYGQYEPMRKPDSGSLI